MDALENSGDQKKPSEGVKQSPTAIEASNSAEDSTARTNYCHKKQNNGPQRIEAVCAVLLVLITGFYTYYARKQATSSVIAANDATESLNTIKNQFQLDQRPYISVLGCQLFDLKSGKAIKKPTVGEPLDATISFQNIGKSAALNTIAHRHILFGKQTRDLKSEPIDGNKNGPDIDPGAGDHTRVVSVKDTYAAESYSIDPAQVIKWDGSQPIVVFGRFTYEDRFGNKYCAPFLERYITSGDWLVVQTVDLPHLHRRTELCPEGKTVITQAGK